MKNKECHQIFLIEVVKILNEVGVKIDLVKILKDLEIINNIIKCVQKMSEGDLEILLVYIDRLYNLAKQQFPIYLSNLVGELVYNWKLCIVEASLKYLKF